MNTLSPQRIRAIEEGFDLDREAWIVLDLIVAEFKSDPMSVQCFDSRTVERAISAVAHRRRLDKRVPFPVFGE